MPQPFDPSELKRELMHVPWVREVHAVRETASTNDDALRLADEGAPHGTVVVADSQTAGRGRLGRNWWSEPGTSLIASWIMRPDEPPERWPRLTLACGVAAAEALTMHTSLMVQLKWPNDVLVGDKKLAGILLEAKPPDAVVAGIGINLDCKVPHELAEIATTVAEGGGTVPQRSVLLAAILQRIGAFLDGENYIDSYRSLCATIGRDIRVDIAGAESITGRVVGVDDSGALVLETAAGIVQVAAGDVLHVR